MTKALALILFSLLHINIGVSQNVTQSTEDSIEFEQLRSDTLFNSRQIISIIKIPFEPTKEYSIELIFDQMVLKKTSAFAMEAEATAAINAGFFNMKSGGSVTYLEINDSLISYTGGTHPEHALNDSLINGVVIITKLNKVKFEYKKPDSIYLKSLKEAAVLATGPILLLNGEKVFLVDKNFVNNRHPRTCLCLTDKELLMITVDGRSEEAAGMSLYELQSFLQTKDCYDAINLDGGGSTTMWLKDRGVVNYPSDKTGERKVANVIIIKEKLN